MAVRQKHVLSLDGGGVRGLSTLIILRDLLCKVNFYLSGRNEPISPKQVFDVIIGTSTGGLIALMMVKLNLDADECIKQYKLLSEEIFGRPSTIGKLSGGIVKPRYSGELVREVVINLIKRTQPGHGEDLLMESTAGDGHVDCTVLCRELESNWTKTRKPEPVFLCSHICRPQLSTQYKTVKMCDAACATSAAPTYFKPRKLVGKTLVDGGFGETNNPSNAALDHYRRTKKRWSLPVEEIDLIWTNIGTGSPAPDSTRTQNPRPWWTHLIPHFILDTYHLMNDLQQIATASEQIANQMRTVARESHGHLQYSRFSANNGLHLTGLDDFHSVNNGEIERYTLEYLARVDVQTELTKTAKALAESCGRRLAAAHRASEINSPIPKSITPLSPAPSALPMSPSRAPQFMADDLAADEVPGLSRGAPTDEASEAPRTPQPSQVQPVPGQAGTESPNTDTLGSGQQFPKIRPHLTLSINEESVRENEHI